MTDLNTLVNESNCIACGIPQGMQLAVLIYLMDLIATNATGQGKCCMDCGNVDPSVPPTCACALYYRWDTEELWFWNASAATWNKVIST